MSQLFSRAAGRTHTLGRIESQLQVIVSSLKQQGRTGNFLSNNRSAFARPPRETRPVRAALSSLLFKMCLIWCGWPDDRQEIRQWFFSGATSRPSPALCVEDSRRKLLSSYFESPIRAWIVTDSGLGLWSLSYPPVLASCDPFQRGHW